MSIQSSAKGSSFYTHTHTHTHTHTLTQCMHILMHYYFLTENQPLPPCHQTGLRNQYSSLYLTSINHTHTHTHTPGPSLQCLTSVAPVFFVDEDLETELLPVEILDRIQLTECTNTPFKPSPTECFTGALMQWEVICLPV